MRYIDKYRLRTQAHHINVRFLKDCYAGDINHPCPSPDNPMGSFEDFKKKQYRESNNYDYGWKNLLLEEQDCRCCYCMRRLNSTAGKINYEHIIPRECKGDEGLNEYSYYASHAPALHDLVEMADVFTMKKFTTQEDIEQEPKMPHITALANLAAACNGKRNSLSTYGCCCNNTRGNKRMMPVMLMPDADENVNYDANGILTITNNDGTLDAIIQELNDDTLKEVRAVWARLCQVQIDLTIVRSFSLRERIEWFKRAYHVTDFTSLPTEVRRYAGEITSNGSDFYWNLLLDYDWFYNYYFIKK